MAFSSPRAPITCHVLDITTGLPVPNLSVTLSLLSISPSDPSSTHPSALFTAFTNADGRVSTWTSSDADEDALETLFALGRDDGRTLVWSLRFATGEYYGEGSTFWPEVEVKFWTQQGRAHVHVPLLLGPYGYTTYRGS
ncbi:Hydroxyisourate hydrolase [Viridothelium virens]|uniref:5-hydroxyisourate hydrolase n=1 Tax=Viridothelium virens TaxID=1048519 RepID=A0A6A6H2I3_VIRVR|nr:Hydroxyisourate hydrolase [Viridothelium virens]